MKTWKDVYQLPLKQISGLSWVEDSEGQFVFQFIPNDPILRENAIKVLNGEKEVKSWKSKFVYKEGFIETEEGARLLLIRGWGHLTGGGATALNLSAEEASNIQNTFAEFIISRLNPPIR